jgi:hypothetical protein
MGQFCFIVYSIYVLACIVLYSLHFSERKTLIQSTRQLFPTLNGYCDDDHAETEIKNFIDNERVTMKGASSPPKTSLFDETVSPFYAVDGSKIDSIHVYKLDSILPCQAIHVFFFFNSAQSAMITVL